MLTRVNQALGIAFLVQVGLAALVWWPKGDDTVEAHPLLPMDSAAVTSIEITGRPTGDQPAEPVVLVKRGPGDWVIRSTFDYPAKADKVDEVLDALTGIKVRKPIATKATSHAKLKVGDKEYGRRAILTAGDQSAELIIGAAASKSIHVRKAGDDDVFMAKNISEWSIGDKARTYWEPKVVDVDADALESLTIHNGSGDIDLQRNEGTWTASAVPQGFQVDGAKVDDLAKRLLTLRMSEPIAAGATPDQGLDRGSRVSWTTEDGGQSVAGGYAIGAEFDTSYVYVQVEGQGHVLKVSKSTVKKALEAKLEDLLAEAEPTPEG